jgi:transposase
MPTLERSRSRRRLETPRGGSLQTLDPGRTGCDTLLCVDSLLRMLRSVSWWQDLPEHYGRSKTAHIGFSRWAAAGIR